MDVFLIPYDGDTGSFLAETAITRSEIFQKVERIGPKSVTVFPDACYTGGTRSQDVTACCKQTPCSGQGFEPVGSPGLYDIECLSI